MCFLFTICCKAVLISSILVMELASLIPRPVGKNLRMGLRTRLGARISPQRQPPSQATPTHSHGLGMVMAWERDYYKDLIHLSPGSRNQNLRDGVHLDPKAKDGGYEKLPIMHVRATYNNTIFTITDHDGRVLAWTSAVSGLVCFSFLRAKQIV